MSNTAIESLVARIAAGASLATLQRGSEEEEEELRDAAAAASELAMLLFACINDHADGGAAVRKAADTVLRSDGLLPLMKLAQQEPHDPVTLKPWRLAVDYHTNDERQPSFSHKRENNQNPAVTELRFSALTCCAHLMTAADSALQANGWELIDSPEGDGRPAYLHRASSIVRNTAPDNITWPNDHTSTASNEPLDQAGTNWSDVLSWSQQLLLDVPTLVVPLPPARIAREMHTATVPSQSAALAGAEGYRRRRREAQIPSTASRKVTPATDRSTHVRWPVCVVEYVRESHAILDAMVEPGRTDVTYRQLVRLDHTDVDSEGRRVKAAWKHTEGLAAMEVMLQDSATEGRHLEPDDDALPLSFTKTTMAALALLALPSDRRRLAMLPARNPFGHRNTERETNKDDEEDEEDAGGLEDNTAMAVAFEAALTALTNENSTDEPDMEALEEQVVQAMMTRELEIQSRANLSSRDAPLRSESDFGDDGCDLATAVQTAMSAAASEVMWAADEFVAREEEPPQHELRRSKKVAENIGWPTSVLTLPPLRVLVIGLSNCCDLLRFFTRQCGHHLIMDAIDVFGENGEAVKRISQLTAHCELPLHQCNYVSFDRPTLVEALDALEEDGEVSSVQGDGDADGNTKNTYDLALCDWATEQHSELAKGAEDAAEAKQHLTGILDRVVPWLKRGGVLCVGSGNLGDPAQREIAAAVRKYPDMSPPLTVCDFTCKEDEPHLSETVVVTRKERSPSDATPTTGAVDGLIDVSKEAWDEAFEVEEQRQGNEGVARKLPMALLEPETSNASEGEDGIARVWVFWTDTASTVEEHAEDNDDADDVRKNGGSVNIIAEDAWGVFGSDEEEEEDEEDEDGNDGEGNDNSTKSDDTATLRAWATLLPTLIAQSPFGDTTFSSNNGQCSLLKEIRLSAREAGPTVESRGVSRRVRVPESIANGRAREYLLENGYAVSEQAQEQHVDEGSDACAHDDPVLTTHLLEVIKALQQRRLPPAFVFMYDAAWELVLRLWPLAEAIMSADGHTAECVLEPSFAAFRLNYNRGAAYESYVGNNFSKPHRDYSFRDAFDKQGDDVDGGNRRRVEQLKVLSVWVPLNRVTRSNGCMYIVPRHFDPDFEDPTGEGLQEPKVPVVSNQKHGDAARAGKGPEAALEPHASPVRPLAPHEAGTFMCWSGNTIHWGSACSESGAADPRTSIALVFRRKDATLSQSEVSLTRRDVATATRAGRLKWVRSALKFFSHWYPDSVDLTFRKASPMATG